MIHEGVTPWPYASGVAELNPQQRDVRDELLLYGQARPTPDRAAGRDLRQRAITELASGLAAGRLNLDELVDEEDEVVVASLRQLRGVGRWSRRDEPQSH